MMKKKKAFMKITFINFLELTRHKPNISNKPHLSIKNYKVLQQNILFPFFFIHFFNFSFITATLNQNTLIT